MNGIFFACGEIPQAEGPSIKIILQILSDFIFLLVSIPQVLGYRIYESIYLGYLRWLIRPYLSPKEGDGAV